MDPFTVLAVVAAAATGAAALLAEWGFVWVLGVGLTAQIPVDLLLPPKPHSETAVANTCGDGGHLEVGIGWSPLGIK